MKISSLVLALSLAANAALVAMFVAGRSSAPANARQVSIAADQPVLADAKPSTAATDVWSVLQSEDRRTEVQKLQAEGFPPSMIRAIITAQVMESLAARRKALERSADAPFWLPPNRDTNAQAALRDIYREQSKLLKELLGPDPENGTAASLRRQIPELPADKIDQLAGIRDRYDEMRSDLYANVRGQMLPEEREKVNALEKAMHNELAAVLSPAELEAYDLRMSNTANNMRYNLAAFDASEQEFRAIYRLQKDFDDQFNNYTGGPMSEEQRKARMDAQKALDENLKSALGADRYAEYQRATDYNYRTTTQLVARLELPPETTNQIYAVQKEYQDRARAIYQDSSIPPQDRTAKVQSLLPEIQGKLTPLLTARGYDAYKQYGGSWLQQFQPRPANAAGTAIIGSGTITIGR